uniref:Formylglycine-generating enzyme, required for sulfatase activity, contains SUMF1/FGE domain n=1 Tax=Candidatus Kentrum sp. LFY TaxID=2126342 RepID=A0A450UKN5_9GAMM|nr:MAG: Formylglycine-generating enzyme, required for sulfatase activity, contains SUMF1/FGE domain [Candidatus Kentron sp. LFY]
MKTDSKHMPPENSQEIRMEIKEIDRENQISPPTDRKKTDYKKYAMWIAVFLVISGIISCLVWCNSDPKLMVSANVPGTMIYLDGESVGSAGSTILGLAAGEHDIRVEKPGFCPAETRITLVTGQEHTVHAVLAPCGSGDFTDLVVDANVSEAEVYIDGKMVGRTKTRHRTLDPGEHKIQVKREGYFPSEVAITLIAGEKHTLYAVLPEITPPPKLIVDADIPESMAYIDGKLAGMTPTPPHTLSPGKHKIRVIKKQHESVQVGIELSARDKDAVTVHALLESLPEESYLVVDTDVPGGIFHIDGNPVDATGPMFHALSPGRHEVRLKTRGRELMGTEITLAAGERHTLYAVSSIDPKPERRLPPEWPRPSATAQPPSRDLLCGRLQSSHKKPKMIEVPTEGKDAGSPEGDDLYFEEAPKSHVEPPPEPFALGATEVTFDEYDRFACATGRELPNDGGWGRGRRPVIDVDWHDAVAYAKWLSRRTGKKYRLPSEAEWEYAARAGSTTRYFWGDEVESTCTYANGYDLSAKGAHHYYWDHLPCDDGQANIAPVGSYQPNPFDLFDMIGNVQEWTADCWQAGGKTLSGGNASGSERDGSCIWRVIRGGAWQSRPANLQSAHRGRLIANGANNSLGFRLAEDLSP